MKTHSHPCGSELKKKLIEVKRPSAQIGYIRMWSCNANAMHKHISNSLDLGERRIVPVRYHVEFNIRIAIGYFFDGDFCPTDRMWEISERENENALCPE
jgi:hypothetical protein